ncbi:MAG: cysteine hydrolase [SAR202 cluster bacterium]|nr:cysteine hydrolase [SAR202 cluster bacterium]MDP6300234.1 cysteine hydrolase [SAR202 cluster bacterium]MDP7224770.1 cysteine hydrolase [SAR202 cluster bacterium]MDP7412758.1 cysteine hydrolase [SAR202 cluster bacterium]HJO82523.1 cysteine hydrolase [SAR202 cluster bacterium]
MNPNVEFQDRSAFRDRINRQLRIDPTKTVVLTVVMQREYLDMEVASSSVLPDEADRVLTHSKTLLDFARSQAIPVVHVYTTRRRIEIDKGFEKAGLEYAKAGRTARLSELPDTSERDVSDRLIGSVQSQVPASLVHPDDLHVTTKKTLDGFQDTELGPLLSRVFEPETVVLTGINTDTCVLCTAFATANRGYKPVVISDCVASMRGKDSHWMALELMSRSIAWVLTVDEFREKVLAGDAR